MKKENILLKGLSKFVDDRNTKKVNLIFSEFHPSEIYLEIKTWPIEKLVLILDLLEDRDSADLFLQMSLKKQSKLIDVFSYEKINEIFEEMYIDEVIDIIKNLSPKFSKKVINSVEVKTKQKINKLLKYDKNKIGYHMVVDYVSIPNDVTFKKAKILIKKQIKKELLEIVGNIFVFNLKTEEYIGYLTPDDILVNDDDKKIEESIQRMQPAKTNDLLSNAQDLFAQYNVSSIPVIDSRKKLVGVLEAEDIIERYEDAEENIFEQSAVKIIDKPYLEITSFELFKSRVPWIIILLIVGTLTQIIALGFQSIWINNGLISSSTTSGDAAVVALSGIATLSITTALSLSSSINDAAGNSGSQTSSTLVRAIALGEVDKTSYGKAIYKEFKTSTMIATTVMITAFVRIIIVWAMFGKFSNIDASSHEEKMTIISYMMLIASIASISFFLTIILGNFMGTTLPIIADKFGIDGAIFSGPVQTTIVDITTILIYFTLTTAIFLPLYNNGVFDSTTMITSMTNIC